LSENDIELKSGCEVVFKSALERTNSPEALVRKPVRAKLRGASYATSKVTITPDQIISWDQGFDKNDKQVWGATKAGYVFDKLP